VFERFFGGGHPPAAVAEPELSATELSALRTEFASRRTLMASDRTLMAWVRTALAMISFGFTIYKLLEGFVAAGTTFSHGGSPRTMGLILTGMGTVSMLLGIVEYLYTLKELRRYRSFGLWRPSFVMALLMSVTGLFLFVAIIAKAL
jgi:putative membrane protein